MQISYEMVSNAHVRQLTVPLKCQPRSQDLETLGTRLYKCLEDSFTYYI